jgi:ubiquitin carboxyl-terminal hydrolase 14
VRSEGRLLRRQRGREDTLRLRPHRLSLRTCTSSVSVTRAAADPIPTRGAEGNTCYANSTLEALRFVPELKDALVEYKRVRGGGMGGGAGAGGAVGGAGGGGGGGGGNLYQQLLAAMGADPAAAGGGFPPGFSGVDMALGDLFARLDASPKAVMPAAFLHTLRGTFPQFDERGAGGGHKQQDAEEFHGALMTALAAELKSSTAAVPKLRPVPAGGSAGEPNLIDTLFGVETEVELKCRETEAEPAVRQREFHRKLVCNIEGGAGRATQINHLGEGILLVRCQRRSGSSACAGC